MSHPKVRKSATLIAAVLVGLMTVSGCSEGQSDSSSAETGVGRAAAPDQAPEQPGKDEPKIGKPSGAVIHTGDLHLTVKDVPGAAEEAIEIVRDVDGYVGRDDRTNQDGTHSAELVLRIPADEFTSSLSRLAGLGKELERTISADEVTDAVRDLDSEIASKRDSVKRMRALLKRARTISEIAMVEAELTERESALASLEARERDLARKIEYSTLTLSLTGKQPPPPPPVQVGFLTGIKAGWSSFVFTVQVTLMALGALLPYAIALGTPIGVIWWLTRRRQRGKPVAHRDAG
ncbi:MAG: DUF4349 domain-containing protein [Micromonosporaceae bacterium]